MRHSIYIIVLISVCAFAVLTALTVHAEATPISDESSEAFYHSCVAKRDPRMTEDHQKEFCACSAVKMQEQMTREETQTMFQPGEEGRAMLNKMLTYVYAPCMRYPVQDLIQAQCMKDPKVASLSEDNTPEELCACMGEETGKWFAANGTRLLGRILARSPNIQDPITPIMESNYVKKNSYQFLIRCVTSLRR